jgi:hypothetical protein
MPTTRATAAANEQALDEAGSDVDFSYVARDRD